MNLIDKLRQKMATRQHSAVEQYWGIAERLASGRLNERDTEAALVQIEALLPVLQKSPDDVEADVAAVSEANACSDAEEVKAKATSDGRALSAEGAALLKKAEAMQVESQRLFQEAENLRHRAGGLHVVADEKLRVAREARKALAERGHPRPGGVL